jgi:hypothetical protein
MIPGTDMDMRRLLSTGSVENHLLSPLPYTGKNFPSKAQIQDSNVLSAPYSVTQIQTHALRAANREAAMPRHRLPSPGGCR